MSAAAGTVRAGSRSGASRRRRRAVLGAGPLEAALYVLPAAALFAVFIVEPIVANIVSSLTGAHGRIELTNYTTAATDTVFRTAVGNSLLWVVVSVAFEIAIGFALAMLIELHLPRGRAVFRTLLFLPMVITPSVIALVFNTFYASNYGLLYGAFRAVGLGDAFPALLGSPSTASLAIIAVNIWQWSGFFVLLYCVGIAAIDRELLDAAAIDGARGWNRVRHILWPLCHGTTTSLVVLGTIQALQQFPLIYLMTEGGPANSSQTLATYIFQTGFSEDRMHYASAVAVVLFLLALALVAIEYRLAGGGFSLSGKGGQARG
ncbi:MAG: carbohydrate ABC transporter permease [Acetobacteraceae bacterium]